MVENGWPNEIEEQKWSMITLDGVWVMAESAGDTFGNSTHEYNFFIRMEGGRGKTKSGERKRKRAKNMYVANDDD